MRSALVIGARGFVGSHLVRHLESLGAAVAATSRAGGEARWRCDVLDAAGVRAVVTKAVPSEVYLLAGWMRGGDPATGVGLNVMAAVNVLEAVAALAPRARVVVTGSAAEYGPVAADALPITEAQPARPVTLYGASKLAQAAVLDRYARVTGVPVVRVRLFNVTGPGEPDATVCGRIARQITDGEPEVTVGTLSTTRDFVDVRDVARALALVATAGVPGEVYNVCAGVETSIDEVAHIFARLSDRTWTLRSMSPAAAPDDVPRQRGSFAKLHAATGWTPRHELSQSLLDLLAASRARARV